MLLEIGIGLAVLVLVFIFRNVLSRALVKLVLIKQDPAKAEHIRPVLVKPLGFLLFFIALRLVLPLFNLPPMVQVVLQRLLNSLFIAMGFWLLYEAARHLLTRANERENVLAGALSQTARKYISGAILIFVVIFGLVLILEQWFDNLGGLITGLGIGGLALALAAQDTASNLVAGLAIMLDKPFDIGDWIDASTSGGAVSGSVVDIGLRSSRIRALDGSFVTVPNSQLGSAVITNGTKRTNRLVDLQIPIRPDTTSAQLEEFRRQVMEIVEADSAVIEDSASVYLVGFARDAMLWQCRFRTDADFNRHMEAKHRIGLELTKLSEVMHIRLASWMPEVK